MLEVKKLNIVTFKDRHIIKDLNITIKVGDKIAVIGEEGNGKSTLLKCIYKKEMVEKYANVTGSILKRGIQIGYLEQFLDTGWNDKTVEEYFLKSTIEEEPNYEKYNEVYQLEGIFEQLKIPRIFWEQPTLIKNLSGGEKVKIQLAKLLFYEPDVLLLDEPTNDIDITTLKWLEQFINTTTLPIMYISHDETLLENTANAILHLEQLHNKTKAKYTLEHMGYQEYIQKRKYLLERQEKIAKNEKKEFDKQKQRYDRIAQSVEYKQETITRQDPAKGRLLKKKMKSVKALEKRLDAMELTQRPEAEEAIFGKFHKETQVPNSKVILDWHLKELKIEDKIIKKDIDIQVIGNEKIGIIGKNGSGKTTLLKTIYQDMKRRKDITVGYMPQNYDELLEPNITPEQFLNPEGKREIQTIARTYLSSMKFISEEILGKIEILSGGQKAKLFLVKLMMERNDVLLLDEPTRNLSPLSNPVIRSLLKKYKGAIISVSHDRKYIEEVCDKVYEM